MKQRMFQPRRMDVRAFIESGEPLEGQTSVSEMFRVCAGLPDGVAPEGVAPVAWQAMGEVVPQRVGAPELWLRISAAAALPFECQRCLHPVTLEVSFDRRIRFVTDETAAASLDAESDDDVLALSRQFDLLALVEDELIMAEPILPRHDECPVDMDQWMQADDEPAPSEDEAAGDEGAKPNPFAALAALKKDKGGA